MSSETVNVICSRKNGGKDEVGPRRFRESRPRQLGPIFPRCSILFISTRSQLDSKFDIHGIILALVLLMHERCTLYKINLLDSSLRELSRDALIW